MKSLTVALGLSLAIIATNAFGQLALRSSAQPKSTRLRQADYHESHPSRSHVDRVGCEACSENIVPDCGCESLFPDCGCEAAGGGRLFTPDCGCESFTPDCGCESFTPDCGCESFTPDCGCESFCGGCAGGCAGGCDAGGLFGTGRGLGIKSGCANPCGCAIGTPTCVPYPRCFLFKSPCLSTPCGVDPCCSTIFSEMWCDIKSWMSTRPTVPSAACCGSCVRKPFGFGNCQSGLISGMTIGCGGGCGGGCGSCFQDILQPRCTGDCCARPAPLRTMASSLVGRVSCLCGGCGGGGCAAPVMCGGCSDAVPDGFADGEYYESYEAADGGHVVTPSRSSDGGYYTSSSSNARTKPRGTSSRYFTVTRPGSNQTEYVTAQEYAMIQAGRAAKAEQATRELKVKGEMPGLEVDTQMPQMTRSPGLKDQSRRASKSGVEKATFNSSKRRTSPRSPSQDSADDYIKFDR